MSIPTVVLNEDTPAGTSYIRAGDDRIREFKTQVRQILAVNHEFPSSGQGANVGRHTKITLTEAADIGTGAEGIPILGAQTAAGKPELVYTDADNKDVQVTKGGKINSAALDTAVLAVVYPIGCIYTTTVATNPATVFGFGTWAAFGAGRVLLSAGGGYAAGATGGAATHTLSVAEIPAHTHAIERGDDVNTGYIADGTNNVSAGATCSTGGGGAHNNLQPYITVYMWQRTA